MNLFNINMNTILITLILGHLLTGILIISYTVQHKKDKSVNTFLLSKLVQLIAWGMLGFKDAAPSAALNIFLICVANSLLFTGAALELIAFLILLNSYSSSVKRRYTALIVICVLSFIIVTAYGAPENIRIVAASVITATLMAFPVYKLLMDKNSSILQKIITVFYSITIISLLCRAYIAFTYLQSMTLWSTNIFNTCLFLLLYLVMLVGSTGFILLAKEKLDLEILKAASFDELTGIFNRRTFILHSKEVISLFARRKEPLSCLLIDIDNFKKINDVHGHYVGDIVLRDFAAAIKAQLGDSDLFGRYGGEEFAILLPGTDEKNSLEVAERLRKTIEFSSTNTDPEIKYTISIGVVTITPDADTSIDILYRLSDNALYAAKTQGRNCVVRIQ